MSYAFYLDLARCTGCMACAVACMDQNDVEIAPGVGPSPAWRQVFQVEKGTYPDTRLSYVSLACMHCEDAPCLIACPTGAIRRDLATGAVVVETDLCIGCHSCSMACPFGVPRFRTDGTMQKCDLCTERLKAGMDPACVRVCPTKALQYGHPNQVAVETEKKAAARLAGGS